MNKIQIILILLLVIWVGSLQIKLEKLERVFSVALFKQVTMSEEQRIYESVREYAKQYPMSKVGENIMVRTAK